MRSKRKLIVVLLLVLLLGLTVAIQAVLKPYPPDAAAVEAMKGGAGITVTESKDWIVFERKAGKPMDVLLYPGQRIHPNSYAPLAHLLAEEGYRTWIIKMPFNMALLGEDRANKVLEMYPQHSYVVGGHSLGGVMAARYAAKHPGLLKGVFFLASYTYAGGNLRTTNLPVLSITGSADDVLNLKYYELSKAYLPEQTDYEEITGGNHAQFGSYGKQKGDRPALISAEKQQTITVNLLVQWLRGIEAAAK